MKNLYIISDIVDSSKGSEFRIALKPIEILGRNENSFLDKITLFVPRRNNNIENIQEWFVQNNIQKIEIKEFKFKYSDENGNHPNKFFFIKDLIHFYKQCRNEIPKNSDSLIFKCGQVNWVFYLFFLKVFKKEKHEKIICAPISGFTFIQLKDCVNLSLKSKIYYLFYNQIIFFGRIVFKLFFINKRNYHFLFATYSDCKVFYNQNIKDKIYSEIEMSYNNIFETKNKIQIINNPIISNNRVSVLWSGQLIQRKNPLLALNIISIILKKLTFIDFYFVGEGPLDNRVYDYMAKNNLINRSDFIYMPKLKRTDFLDLIKKVDFVFITSLREVNSMFFIESLVENKKIFALKNSGLKDFNLDSVVLYDTSRSNNLNDIAESLYFELSKPILNNSTGYKYLEERYQYEKNNLIRLLKNS